MFAIADLRNIGPENWLMALSATLIRTVRAKDSTTSERHLKTQLAAYWSLSRSVTRALSLSYYSISALLPTQTAVIGTANLSVRRTSVCLSVTFRCYVHMNEDM